MSVTTIPEKRIKNCDWCGKDITKDGARMGANMRFDSAGLDYQGSPVGPGVSFNHDYCDNCADEVLTLLREGHKTKRMEL